MASLNFLTGDRDPEFGIQQPKDVVTPLYTARSVNGKMVFTWNKNFKAKWTNKYVTAQEFIDNAVLHDCEPYTPHRVGILVFSSILGTKIGSGTVSWTTPYARYQYYGKVMVPSPFGGPKILTKRNLKYHGGGKRGAFWFERAKEVHKDKWIKGAQAIITAGKA
jgi:hypothetical protein